MNVVHQSFYDPIVRFGEDAVAEIENETVARWQRCDDFVDFCV